MTDTDLYARLEELGIDRERLKTVIDNENWGALVHAFEVLTVLGTIVDKWPPEHVVWYEPRDGDSGELLLRAACSCGKYRSGWGTPASATKAWRDHVHAKEKK